MIIYSVVMSAKARKDMNNIGEYIAFYSVDNSISFTKKLWDSTQNTLSIFPEKHTKHKTYHFWCYGNYLIFFSINKKEKIVNVVRIVNSSQYSQYKTFFI